MCFLFLSLALAPRPAQAQSGGSWYGFPCDSQGNPLPNNTYNNGFYTLYGPQSGTDSNTYPLPMINAALAYPSLYGDYLYAATPSSYDSLGLSPHAVSVPGTANFPNDRVGAETPGFAFASNYGSNGEGSYSVDAAHGGPSSGPINGSVTADLSGQLVGYFKMYWSGPGPQPASAPFLVSTSLYAQANVNYGTYGGTTYTSGLSASAWATDGIFNERASASAGSGSAGGNASSSQGGYHLVRAAVDPVTNIAEVYVNGVTHWSLSNMAPYATAGETTASGGSLVEAGARTDNREVEITCPAIEDSYYKGSYDSQHGTDRYQHLRDPVTGAIVTDSAVTYQNASNSGVEGSGAVQGWQVNNITLTANTPGFASPAYAWSLTGPSQAFLTVPAAKSVNYSLLEPDSNKFPLSGTVKAVVTDSDKASAANTFGITWHLPREANQFLGTVYTKHKRGAARVGPVDYGTELTAKAEGAEDVDVSAVFDAGEAITAAAGQEEYAGLFKIAASLAKITDTKYPYGPENEDFGVSNKPTDGNWKNAINETNEKYAGDPNISPATLASDPNGQELCHLYWYDVEKDNDSSWYADGYDIHGYDGNSQHTIFVRQCDMIEGQPFFVQYKNHDGSPVSGA